MKKFIFSILLLFLVFGLYGCAQNKELTIENTYEQTPSDLIEEYTENEEDMEPITIEADWSEHFDEIGKDRM